MSFDPHIQNVFLQSVGVRNLPSVLSLLVQMWNNLTVQACIWSSNTSQASFSDAFWAFNLAMASLTCAIAFSGPGCSSCFCSKFFFVTKFIAQPQWSIFAAFGNLVMLQFVSLGNILEGDAETISSSWWSGAISAGEGSFLWPSDLLLAPLFLLAAGFLPTALPGWPFEGTACTDSKAKLGISVVCSRPWNVNSKNLCSPAEVVHTWWHPLFSTTTMEHCCWSKKLAAISSVLSILVGFLWRLNFLEFFLKTFDSFCSPSCYDTLALAGRRTFWSRFSFLRTCHCLFLWSVLAFFLRKQLWGSFPQHTLLHWQGHCRTRLWNLQSLI